MTLPITLLLVEDDTAMLNGIAEWLEIAPLRYDINVVRAGNGLIALDMMTPHTPDLIVSDIMMPEMGGYEFLSHVRLNPAWIHIPFIFLSARGEERDIRKGRLSDADLYLTKPFDIRALTELIQTQLDRHFERKQLREQALESLKKNMLQILNHEFRTPLTYVTAYYDMLKDNLDSDNYRDYLRGIQAGCVRLTHLVNDLILVVELRSGALAQLFQEQARPLSLNFVIEEAVTHKAAFAAENRVEIIFDPSQNVAPVFGDTFILGAIFERLLDNAIKFSQPEPDTIGSVRVLVEAYGKEVHVSFRDEGMGIPEKMHERIFDLFEQYNRGLLEQQGTGIGLTIAKELTELHNGRIELSSVENIGSNFTVVLPVHQTSPEQSLTTPGGAGTSPHATILLVEDDENLLYGLADLLEIHDGKYQFNVLTALNGQQGLETISESVPDLIISDIMMPLMNGYELLQSVRQNPDWLDIPFIFLTARGEGSDRHKGLSLGVEEYITKPYESEDVLLFIEKQLDKHFSSQQSIQQDFESLKRNILNLIPHEIMQPLTAVSVHTERLTEGLEMSHSENDLANSLRQIQEGGLHLNNLIEDLISLAELVTGEAAMSFNWQAQPIADLGMLVHETAHAIGQQRFPETEITCSIVKEIALVLGDSSLLTGTVERLLTFIVMNSEPRTSQVAVEVESGIDDVLITLSGPLPLAEKPAQTLSEIIYNENINLAPMPAYAACLYIVKGNIGLHSGRLELVNDPVSGCRLTVALPVFVPVPHGELQLG